MKPSHGFAKLIIAVAAMLALSAILGAMCDRNGDESTAETPTPMASAPTSSPTSSPTTSPTAAPTETPAPTPTALPTATPTPAPLGGADIFSRVSPNVPIVITRSGLGSGVLIPGGFIVTNAHVVWGYPNVLIKFPNSNTHRTLPVIGLDLMADLAVIGPVNMPLEGLELRDGEDLAIGSDVYLVGYPDEVEVFPDKPTITRGIISRFRQWPTLGLTLIQSDAVAAGGQSGGVMVSEYGQVIGITTRTIGEGKFIIATSTADIRERVDGLIQDRDVDGLRDRRLPSRGATEHEFRLTDRWDSKIAVLYEPEETDIEIRLESETDSAFAVTDVAGELILNVDDTESGVEWGSTTLETLGPHFVLFEQFSSEPGEFALRASHDLYFIDDEDDHRRVSVNEMVVGNVDAPLDEDYFELQLDAGESVTIRVESFTINPYVRVTRADWTKVAIEDDNGGGGPIGHDAYVSFTASESGTHIVLVSDSWDNQVGGYFLKIDGAPGRAVSPSPATPPAPRPVASPRSVMSTYTNTDYEFSIQYPADWLDSPLKSVWEGYESQFRSENDEFLTVRIHDLPRQGLGAWSLDDYVDFWVSWIESDELGGQITANVEYGNIGGRPARLLTYTHSDTQSIHLIFVSDQKIAYSAIYDLRLPPAEETLRMVMYSFSTFTVRGQALQVAPEFAPIETDSPVGPIAAPESAREPLWFVPMATYRNQEFKVSIQHPTDWDQIGRGSGSAYFLSSARDTFFMQIWVDNLPKAKDRDGIGFDELVEEWRFNFESNSYHRIISSMRFGELNGLPAQLLVSEVLESSDLGITLLCFSEDGDLYQILFVTDAAVLNEVAPILEYSFRSITVEGNPLTNTRDFPDLQNAFSSATVPSTESAHARGRFMPMLTYGSQEYPFTIQYPAEWEAEEYEELGVRISSDDGDFLDVLFIDNHEAGLGDVTLNQAVEAYLSTLDARGYPADAKPRLVSSSRFGQIAGRPAHLLIFNSPTVDDLAFYFSYLDEGGVLSQVLFFLYSAQREDLQQIVDYSLRSITIEGAPLTDAPEFPSLKTVSS